MPNTPSSISSGFSDQHSPNSEINANKQFRIEELSPREYDNNSSLDLINLINVDDNYESQKYSIMDNFEVLKDLATGNII